MRTTLRTKLRALALLSIAATAVAIGASLASCSSSSDGAGASGPDGSVGAGDGAPGGDSGVAPTPPLDCTRPLALDTGFAAGGVWRSPPGFAPESKPIRLASFPDGGVLLAAGNALAKIGADGVVDPAFQPDQVFYDPDLERQVAGVAVDPHGVVYAAWNRTGAEQSVVEVGRLTATGALDGSFGAGGSVKLPSYGPDGGVVSTYTLRFAFGGDGAVFVMGTIASPGGGSGSSGAFLTKLDASGHAVTSYGNESGALFVPLASGTAGLAPRGDGHALYGLSFHLGSSQTVLLSLDPNGVPEKTFGDDGGLAPDFMKNTGELFGLTSGDALARGDTAVRKLHPDGDFDVAFGTDGGYVGAQDDTSSGGDALYFESTAVRADGSFALMALRHAGDQATETAVVERFDADGRPCGPRVDVPHAFSTQVNPVLAIAPSGALFVAGGEPPDAGNVTSITIVDLR